MKDSKMKKLGTATVISQLFIAGATTVAMSYISFCYTDLGHCDPAMVGIGMTIVGVAGFFWSLFAGALVQKTHTRFGMFRPWMMIGAVGCALFSFLCVLDVGDPVINCVLITLGYFLAQSMMDPMTTGAMGIYEKMSEGDSEKRTWFGGLNMAGGNIGYIIWGAIFLTLVAMIGGDNQNLGFAGTNAIILVLAFVGAVILWKVAAPYDKDNRGEKTENMPGVGAMMKSVVKNPSMDALCVADIVRYLGYYLFTFLLVYMCNSVLEDLMAYSFVLVMLSVTSCVGSLIAPALINKIGGRKKSAIIFCFIAAACYVLMAFFGQTFWGLIITVGIAALAQAFFDSIDFMMYLDAGEIWYAQTGEDTRAYCMNMSNLVGKISQALSGVCLAAVLGAINYSEGVVLDAAGKTTLTLCTALLPAIGLALFSIIMLCFHKVSDKQLEEYIAENAKKDAELYGDMGGDAAVAEEK